MMSWVDYIHDYAKTTRNEFLWLDSDQLGDWLALDTEDIMHLKGRTPDDLIASAYYYLSATIVAKTAKILHSRHEHEFYQMLADKIHEAFIAEFFTASGRLITDTQTGLALCLAFQLYPEEFRYQLVNQLVTRIEKNQNHLTTGFVGTPVLLPALSNNGQHELACQLFLNEDYPGWLNEVNLGATTIWERWDSIRQDGTIEQNGMNSLNHYSTGAVMSWAYEYLLGIKKNKTLIIKPQITAKFTKVAGYTQTNHGQVAVSWEILNPQGNQVYVRLDIPYGETVQVELPRISEWQVNHQMYHNGDQLPAGHYEIIYEPEKPFINRFDIHTPLSLFDQITEITDKIKNIVPFWEFL